MKKSLYIASFFAIFAGATSLLADDASEATSVPMTSDETAAIDTWKSLLTKAPDSAVWTTETGRRTFMKLLRAYMPKFGGPHGGGKGPRGPRRPTEG
ncbi:MAG: hypothetical protein QG632_625 [Candidatus Dependentiae bacterium]|nr:hypothetical protein [Candidatus Dependentiae bacterium]